MKRMKYSLYQTACSRCQKPITTSSRPLFGFMESVSDLKGICEECITPQERDRMEQVTRSQAGKAFAR